MDRKATATRDTNLVLDERELPSSVVSELKRTFERSNPKFFKARAMRFWTGGMQQKIRSWAEDEHLLLLPRGEEQVVRKVLSQSGIELCVEDRTLRLPPVKFKMRKPPLPFQAEAVEKILEAGGNCVIRGPCGSGKALANRERVILRDRTVPISEVRVGDMAAGTDGKFYPVTGVYPQGVRRIYRVKFTDGSRTDCDGDHIWTLVKRRNNPKSHGWKHFDITTKELARKSLRSKGGRNYYLPEIHPLGWGSRVLPLDPYLLGILLGDGGFSQQTVLFTTADPEIFSYANLPKQNRFKLLECQGSSGKASTYILARKCKGGRGGSKSVKEILRELGLMGKNSHTKFVPETYKRSSPGDRLALLQGLLDTDGCPAPAGTAEYSTVSHFLAKDVSELVRSLGGTCPVKWRLSSCNGKKFPSFRMLVKLPTGVPLFRLPRKQEKIDNTRRQREPYRAVSSIKKMGFEKATCISVASPDRLFLTGEFIPTHNTVLLLAAIARIAQPTIVVVHSRALAEQWKAMVTEFLGVVPGFIGGGKVNIRPITVALQQTVWRCEGQPWISQFGALVGDEIHKFAAKTFNQAASMFPATYRFGASADERRKDGLEFLVHETFGPLVYEIKKEDLVGMGRLVPVDVEFAVTEHDDDNFHAELEIGVKLDWVGMINRLASDPEREALIIRTLIRVLDEDPANKVLVLSDRVEACVRMRAEVNHRVPVSAGLMIGGQENRDELERTIAGLNTGRRRVGFGTTVADEGLDIPSLTHVFITCPVHTHPKRLTQMAGRAARACGEKKHGVLVYFWDRKMFPDPTREEPEKFIEKILKACGGSLIGVRE